jgi:predicted nucleic-acid-binding Zn-ribbon protein
MKRTKRCPKCRSRNVGFSSKDETAVAGHHTDTIGRQEVAVERWLCVDCGLLETYAIDHHGVDWPAVLDHYYGPIEKGPYR